ncbi:MAG: SpoIID/LytB domain-containing protein [Elusimicrobiales bacterium]
MLRILLLIFSISSSRADAADAAGAYRLYLDGNLSRSAAAYLELAASDPAAIEPLMNAAIVYKQLGRYADGAAALEKALQIDPYQSDVLSELGWLKFHQADYAGAQTCFERALGIQPLQIRSILGLTSVYSNLGDKEKALEYLDRYRKLRPDFAGVDYIMAWNYMNFKMYREAQESLIEALRKDASFIEARLPLAGIYAREGKFNEAWNQYYRVMDYAPDHPIASKMMKVLEGRLSKQPEEIRPPFRIVKPLKMEAVPVLDKLARAVTVRVGIGTGNTGKQGRNTILKFKSYTGLIVRGKASGKIYAHIPPDSVWSAAYSDGKIILKDPAGTVYGNFSGALLLRPRDLKHGTVIFENVRNSPNPWIRYSDREYRGMMELSPLAGRGIGIVNLIDMEVYLLGVVPSEVSAQWPYESLKAQAVLARTQAIIRRARGGSHKADGYHMCDGQHCQAYKGVMTEANTTDNAVLETEGELLTYHARPAYTFYHSNCGGYIQASSEVTGWGDSPYLTTHQDLPPETAKPLDSPWKFHQWITGNPPANCNYPGRVRASEFRWVRIIKHKDMEFRINKDYKIGTLLDLIPLKRSPSGNVNSIRLAGSKKTVDVDREHLIRNILGFSSIKSTLFFIEVNRFKNGKVRNYWIYGGGWGHGIGMCQSGAAGMAGKYGRTYREIIEFYFPGTKINKLKYIRKKPSAAKARPPATVSVSTPPAGSVRPALAPQRPAVAR